MRSYTDGKQIFVPDYLRGIGLLEISTKQVRWLSMEKGFALNGIDGLYFDRGTLIAVQNGTSPERGRNLRLGPFARMDHIRDDYRTLHGHTGRPHSWSDHRRRFLLHCQLGMGRHR